MENLFIFQQIQYVMYFSLIYGIVLQWSIRSRSWPKNEFDTFSNRFFWIYYITVLVGAAIIVGLPDKGFLALLETSIYYSCILAISQFMLLIGFSIAEPAFKKRPHT